MKKNIKMKKIIYSFLGLAILTFSLNSCVKDTDYETPQVACEEPAIDATQITSIEAVLNNWHALNPGSYDRTVLEFADATADPVYLSGYVVSSDKTGNFYKELFIQDDPVNPQHAVKIAIDMRSLFTKYNIGRKIYVQLNGLGLNKVHGEYVIGELDGADLIPIRENKAKKQIKRSCTTENITAKVLSSVNDINDDMIGMFVQLNNMQFDRTEIGKTFVDPADSYDSHRLMKNCIDDAEIKLETSTFASFKDNPLPDKKGSIVAIVSRDYRDDYYVLRVLGPEAFNFTDERCDPPVLDCNGTNVGGNNIVFFEDFESYNSNDTNLPGWTNINVNGGSTLFKVGSYQGNKFIKCSAYNTGENPLEVWLVTPAINLDNSTGELLSFKTKTGYNNGAALSVYVSTDFTGDINTATWMLVDADIADGPSSGYMNDFVEGTADISCLSGDVYVAFKYKGGDGGITTTFQIDDIKVSAN
jgi:hypothetical protein